MAWEQFHIKEEQTKIRAGLAMYRKVFIEETQDAIVIKGNNLNFSAYNFSTDILERAMYPFQLVRANKVYLNIDHKVKGLGDTSLSTLTAHRVLPGTYEFSYAIKSIK